MGKLYLVDIDNTLLDCLSGLEQVYPGYSKEQQLTYEFARDNGYEPYYLNFILMVYLLKML